MSMPGRNGMVLNFDLNAYPEEAAAVDAHPVVQEVVNVLPANAPIDVEAFDDEVMVLLPPQGRSSRAGNRSRAAHPPILIDEDFDDRQDEAATRLTLNSYDWSARNPPNPTKRTIINCDNHENLDSKHNAKKTRAEENPKPKDVEWKEPTFNCTICLGPLVEETSTSCGHIFCLNCIKPAIRAQKKCPTCRKSLTMKSIHRIYFPAAE